MTGQPTETKRLPRAFRTALPPELADKTGIYAKDLPDELKATVWEWFLDGVEPLREAGQLGSVLLQYPRWFFTSSQNRDLILEAQERLGEGVRVAVEFRNASWFNAKNIERTMRFLEEHKLPLVMVDGPQGFKSSVPPIAATTSPDLAVVRFHGRRAAAGGGAAGRRPGGGGAGCRCPPVPFSRPASPRQPIHRRRRMARRASRRSFGGRSSRSTGSASRCGSTTSRHSGRSPCGGRSRR